MQEHLQINGICHFERHKRLYLLKGRLFLSVSIYRVIVPLARGQELMSDSCYLDVLLPSLTPRPLLPSTLPVI